MGSLSVGYAHVEAEMGAVRSVGFWYLTCACGVFLSGGSSTALSLCPSITEGFPSRALHQGMCSGKSFIPGSIPGGFD